MVARPARFERATPGFVDRRSLSPELRTHHRWGGRRESNSHRRFGGPLPEPFGHARAKFHRECPRPLDQPGEKRIRDGADSRPRSGTCDAVSNRTLPIKLCPLKTGAAVLPHGRPASNHISKLLKNRRFRSIDPGVCRRERLHKNWYAAPDSNRDCHDDSCF